MAPDRVRPVDARLSWLADLASLVTGELGVGPILSHAARVSAEVFAGACVLGVLSDDERMVARRYTCEGATDPAVVVDERLTEVSGEPWLIAVLAADTPILDPCADGLLAVAAPFRKTEARSAVATALRVRGRPVGFVLVWRDGARAAELDASDAATVAAMAGLLATALAAERTAPSDMDRRARRIIDSAMVGVWEYDGAGRTTFMNGHMAQILATDVAHGMSAQITDFIEADERDAVVARFRQRERGLAGRLEQRIRRADGSAGWIDVESRPHHDASGRFAGALAIVSDVTERTRAEAKSREVERRFNRLFESGIIGIVLTEADGVITSANDAFLATVGQSRVDLDAGRLNLLEMTPPEWRPAIDAMIAPVEEQGTGRLCEIEYFHRDGARVPTLVGVAALADRQLLTVVLDLTARKRAEAGLVDRMRTAALTAEIGMELTANAGLRETLERCCAAIVRHLGAAFARIWTVDASGSVLELQASAGLYAHIDGQHARVPIGRFKIGMIAEERRPHLTNDVPNDPRVGDPEWARRERMRAFAGHPLLVDGELVGVMAMFSREVLTDAASNGLAATADAIAVRVKGKLADSARRLLAEQLLQSQKMDAIGRLAGGVAHDFNNSLSVILSYADLLLDDLPRGDRMRDDLEEIRKAGRRAAELTRQLLVFSRQQVLEPNVLDLNEMLSGMERMLCRILGEDIDIAVVRSPTIGRVLADAGSLEQVLMNLVVNARDAMPHGGKLTIETREVTLDAAGAESPGGPHVMLTVSDTGTGMDEATQARIFEPFFTTKPSGQGTGLGLSTVFGIVQQSRGSVRVRSRPGAGTTFEIYLPLVGAEELAVARQRTEARHTGSLRGTETILLVEDEAQVRDVARGILRRYGYVVLEATTPAEAVDIAAAHTGQIDLLLTDVVMPQMGGPALAKLLLRTRPNMRVVCMSGYTDDAAVRHGGGVDGGFPYLQKPLTVEALGKKVRDVLATPAAEVARPCSRPPWLA
jgi:PAS domain S-box-containing protein